MLIEKIKKDIVKPVTIDYTILDCRKSQDKTGLFIYLHGSGERGKPDKAMASDHLMFTKEIRDKQDMIFVMPRCENHEIWDHDAVATLTRELQIKYNIPPKRTYLAGHSMGARGVWHTACKHPELYDAIMPVSGFSYYLMAERLKKTRVYCFHGKKDPLVPIEESRRMIESIMEFSENKDNVIFYRMKYAGHGDTAAVFSCNEIYDTIHPQNNPVHAVENIEEGNKQCV